MTDPSPSQTEPTEPAEGKQDAPGADDGRAPQGDQPPRWSERQPEPAPWYVGRPGAPGPGPGPQGPYGPRPQGPGGWGAPPSGSQGAGTPQGGPGGRPGASSQGPDGQQGAPGAPGPRQGQDQGGQNGRPGPGPQDQGGNGQGDTGPGGQPGNVPAWTGRLPERGQGQGQGQDQGQGQGRPGQGGRGPGGPQYPPGPQGQHGNHPAPWHDPNRYGPPQQRPQQRPQAPAEERGPLDLRTRWARGLALGATACMLIAVWYMYTNLATFPTFLISAGVSLVLGMAGLWLGVFAQRAAMRRNKRAPVAVSAIVWSSIAAFISLMILAYSMADYTQLHRFAQCERAATTIALQQHCVDEFKNSFGNQSGA